MKKDPQNANFQRQLAREQDFIGSTLVSLARLGVSRDENLASAPLLFPIGSGTLRGPGREGPDHYDWVLVLNQIHQNIGFMHKVRGDEASREGCLHECLAGLDRFLPKSGRAREPNNPEWRRGIAESEKQKATILFGSNDFSAMLAGFRPALEVYEGLSKRGSR